MSTTLTNGLKLPDKGSVDWYADMQNNYTILDGAVGTIAEHTSQIAGKAPAVHTHGNITNDGKLATASKALVTDSNKNITTSSVSDTELGYLSGVTSAIQTQLNAKAADTDVVHKSGNETIAGDKTWSDVGIYNKGNLRLNTGYTLGTLPASEDSQTIITGLTSEGNFVVSIATYQSATRGTGLRLSIRNKWDNNNNLNPTGTSKNAHLEFLNTNNRISYLTWSGFVDTGLYPLTNGTYDLGSSSYQWNNLYAKNYYYNGVAWGLDKVNTWSAIQTISYAGSNIAIALKHQETDITASPTRNNWHYINFYDKNSVVLGGFNYAKRTNGNSRVYLNLRTKNTNNDIVEKNVFFETNQEGTDWNLYPASNADINLGTSTNKWKSLNGINPGALSLPKIAAKTSADISSAIVGTDGKTQYLDGISNFYTAALDGWISICISGFTQSNELWITVYDEQNETWGTSGESGTSSRNTVFIIFPIRANQKMRIRMRCTAVVYARFYPCEGNV